jgi:hypothetical protein
MPSPFSQATGLSRAGEIHVIGSPRPQHPLLQEVSQPLSLYERWSIAFGLIAAAIAIEVAERLPRLDRFKPHDRPFRFPTVTGACDADRRYATVKAEIVDLRRDARRRPGSSPGEPLGLVGPRD